MGFMIADAIHDRAHKYGASNIHVNVTSIVQIDILLLCAAVGVYL